MAMLVLTGAEGTIDIGISCYLAKSDAAGALSREVPRNDSPLVLS